MESGIFKFFKVKSSTVPEYRGKTEQNRYWSQVRKYQNISFPIFHVDFWQIRPWNQTVGYQPNLNNKQNRGLCAVSVRLWNFFNSGSKLVRHFAKKTLENCCILWKVKMAVPKKCQIWLSMPISYTKSYLKLSEKGFT